MAENSKIEWTDHTFNPWMGCTKVSDGCKNCYAETLMDKRYKRVRWGPEGKRIRTSAANWKKPIKWNRQAEQEGRRYRVFCGSLCDVFEEKDDQPELGEWRVDLFDLIDQTPNLDWLLLTKQPENIQRLWPWGWYGDQFSWPNVWIGTSVEDQATADERIPHLLGIPAAVRFLSCEPLLGPINLLGNDDGLIWPWAEAILKGESVDWVIVGGESGPGKRPMELAWARAIRDQCQSVGVPFFMKQIDKKQSVPNDLFIREFPMVARS